jgi:hypothetical protein
MMIAKCTLRVSEMMKFVHEYEGEQYITFEVAKMKQQDKFGRDYTVYCTTKEETQDEKPEKKARKKSAKKSADIPF